MKYLLLPVHLLNFWYLESAFFFITTWKNTILYLEEDLAVGLMLKLLFVPLFHDSSFIGYILSFIFRISRVLIGLFAFILASIFIFILAVLWFLLPLLILLDFPQGIRMPATLIALSGLGFFLIHLISHPHQTTWQIKENFWASSRLKKKDVKLEKILQSNLVANLLSYLELNKEYFSGIEIKDTDEVGKLAFNLAKASGSKYIEASHFFVAILQLHPNIDELLLKFELTLEDFKEAVNFLQKKMNKWRMVLIWDSDFAIHHLKGVNRGWLGVPTPNLDSVSLDLTKLAASWGFPDFIGRVTTVSEIINILSEEQNRNVALVAPPGSGKSALVKFLAKQVLAGDAPPALATKRIVLLETTRLISGMRTQGELADRVKTIFEEIGFAGNIILVIEEIHNLGIGEVGSSMNLYSLMQPYLESDSFQFLVTTEPENYSRILEKNGSFARLFTKVELPPATPEETLQILEDRAIEIERKTKIKISLVALKKVVELSKRLIHDRVLPDCAISTLEETKTEVKSGWILAKNIEEVLSHRVNVPTMELGNVGKEKLLNLEAEIHQLMIDQEEAVKKIADSLRRSATGLREENRPIGSFLFVGPTGVGKTELAKTLTKVYFQDGGAYSRLDMSEFQDPSSVNKLIGGAGEEGQLTETVRTKPYGLILLDEFEKANQQVLTLFLQVLEDGRLTDGTGKTVDFTNTIIIATSNAASLTIARGLQAGQTLETLEKQVQDELLTIFKPELINRFDSVVLFKPLSQKDLEKIVHLKLSGLQKQMRDKGYLVEFDEGLMREVAKRGFDPVLGARPMRRLIQDGLEANLSKMILEGKLTKGQPFTVGVELL